MEFAGFLGNTALKQRLSASFQSGRASHCYLLCGPEGSGKRTLANILAAALQCEGHSVPCGRCGPCRKVFAGIHPDVITIDDPEKKTVSVELVRQLQADAYVRPNEGSKKVYLIPRAMDMTDNAEKLLPTVRSRAVELRMEPVPQTEALTWLQGKFPLEPRESLLAACVRSGGYLGQAEALLQGSIQLPQTAQFARCFAERDRYGMTLLLCSLEKQPRDQLLDIFLQWKQLLTDALLVRSGIPGSPDATRLGSTRTAVDLADAAKTVQTAMDRCTANVGAGHICGWLAATLR